MANWLLVLDPDDSRRKLFADNLEATISPFENLRLSSAGGQGWNAVWAAGENAPVNVDVGEGGGAIVWGEARDGSGDLQPAAAIRSAWAGGTVAQWDGYYAAAVVDEHQKSLVVGTDILGIFPVYYWADNHGVSMVATSPELFRSHPAFRPEISLPGLVGILLTNGLVGGKCLWRNVTRLAPGHRIRISQGHVREDLGYSPLADVETTDLPFVGDVQRMDSSMEAAVRRHVPDTRHYGLMLSGGLDSRLLAGYVAERQVDVSCLTFGHPRDIELRCAAAVTRKLGFNHIKREVPNDSYAAGADRLARWELLANGFSGVPEWAMQDAIGSVADRMIVGHIFDGIVGGIHIGWAHDPATGEMGLDTLLPTILAWGMDPEALKVLLEPEARQVVDDVLDNLHQIYTSSATRDHHKAWLFDLHHRQRLHVGSALWPISFAAWPVAPFLDRDVMDVAASLPCSSISDRRLQSQMLVRRFPQLAQLPIDRNSLDMMPPQPRLKDFVLRSLDYRVQALLRTARNILGRVEPERVYYRRLYDVNSPGWRNVRDLAEPYRNELDSLFLSDRASKLLPKPGEAINVDNPVKDTSYIRNLMGLALCQRNLKSV